MIAIRSNDRCFSTALEGRNPFNTDHQTRTSLSVEEAATAFDFTVEKKPSFDERGKQIPSQYHLRRSDDDAFIPMTTSVGERFTVVQHRDVFEYITQKVMPNVPSLVLEMAGTINGGGTTLIAARFGDTFSLPGDDSPQELRLMVNNPTNGSGRMTIGFTNVRVVCQNTLIAATREAKADGWCIKHTQSAPARVQFAVKAIEGQASAAIEMKRRCELLARTGIGASAVAKCLDAIYPYQYIPEGPGRTRMIALRDSVMEQFESGQTAQTMREDTAWKMFNSFTYEIFNPKKLKKNTDIAHAQLTAQIGYKSQKVLDILDKVERVVYAA